MSDETDAQMLLVEMQQRLSEGPHAALGISMHATAADIRRAFLELTKRFHPARFVRMSTETQKLSNEVFLSLRAAHDSLAKPTKGRPSNPSAPNRPTAPLPPLARQGRAASPQPSETKTAGQTPTVKAPEPAASKSGGLPANLGKPPTSVGRNPTPPTGIRIAPTVTSPKPAQPASQRPAGAIPVPAAKASSTMPVMDRELAPIYELIQNQQWEQARSQLKVLVARAPDAPKYRALVHYTIGREAQLGGDRDAARDQLLSALELDPDLQLAKTAHDELFTRRR